MSELRPSLRVLGPPALHGPDGEPIPFRVRKHFALLIFLALEPTTHRRDKLAALLWPKATTSEARHSLATGLSVLRAKLGRERLETSRETARLLPGTVELDLDRLARGEIHATDSTPALQVAPLLHDLVIQDAEPWDHWRDGMVAKWQPAIRDALLARIERSRRQGNTRSMEVLADALLLLDDLCEEGVRAKMESRAFAGDRLTALQIYEDWRVRLADELGAQPSDLVAGMALRLRRRGWERTSSEHIPSVRTDQWKDRPFVGRAKEYEVLYEGWEGCQRGTPRHALITGESGVGKSTLVERLTTAAGLQGAAAARIQCHEVEKEIPYGAIGGLIGLLLDKPGATAVAPEWLGELSRTVSAVRRRFPNVAPPIEATGEMVRIRLADAFHELVRAIAEEQPLILVMDDIHLGDDASAAVMYLLLRRLTDERVLVICTLRQGEGTLGPSARGMLERAEVAQMGVLPLPPLNEAEISELLGHLVPPEHGLPPATVRRALMRAANGLPMLLELLVRDWLGHGDRCVALALQAMTEEPGAAGGAGETYRRLLERLTVGLDPNSRSVLNLAAILGGQLNEFELYGLVDLTLAQAMSGLSQLATLRIMRDGGHGLEFINEVMRGEVYLAVPSSVRKVLHSKVADRLIERAADGEEMLGLAIAWHCMRSGRVQEAGEWLIKGGNEAIERSALAEAEAALESGWRNLTGAAQVACGTALIDVLFDQARYAEALAQALTLCTAQGRTEGMGQPDILRLCQLEEGWTHSQEHEPAFTELLEMIRSHTNPGIRLRAAILAGAIAGTVLDMPTSDALANALRDVLPNASAIHAPRYELLLAQVLYSQRQIPECERILHRLRERSQRDGPSLHAYNLALGLGTCRVARGDYDEAGHWARTAATLARLAGAPTKEATAFSNLAVIHYRLGDLTEAENAARHALALGQAPQLDTTLGTAHGVMLGVSALSGNERQFADLLARSRRTLDVRMSPQGHLLTALWIADALLIVGHKEDAAAEALRALSTGILPAPGQIGLTTRWAWLLRERLPSGVADRLINHAVLNVERSDLLDQLEVAAVALASPKAEHNEKAAFTTLASAARQALPSHAIRLCSRLGLPPITVPALAQDSHPAT